MTPKRPLTEDATDLSDDDLTRFCQSYKRLRSASKATTAKDEEVEDLKQRLQSSELKEKDMHEKFAASQKALQATRSSYESQITKLKQENDKALDALRLRNVHLGSQFFATGKANKALASEKAALQEQVSKMETEHKELIVKFNMYKKRVQVLGNEE